MRSRAYRRICSPKFRPFYLTLVLSIIILLLYSNWVTYLTTYEVVKTPNSIAKHSCSFHSLPPKEAHLADLLKQLIIWPKGPDLASFFFLYDTSDPARSSFTILPPNGGRSWHVGDQLEVLIKMYDFYGRPKEFGGDFLLVRLHNPILDAGVAGKVLDHRNGTYSAIFSLLWEGRVILVHPSEGIVVLEKLTQEQPDRIYFRSLFRQGSVNKSAICNICLNKPHRLCNYSDPITGEPWFCYKPKNISCNARITHSKGGFIQNLQVLIITQHYMYFILFYSAFNYFLDYPGEVRNAVSNGPAGYYYLGVWRALDGTTVHQFNTATEISQCLKNKRIHLYGDSTIRQWFEYLNGTLPGPFLALDYTNNILLTFRSHGPPIRFRYVPVSQLRYIANELDRVVGGENTVVIIGIWSHFSTFPVEVYIRRLLNVRKAVVRLLNRAPGTLVIIRTANPKTLTLYESLTNSDWYSLQRDKILRAIFQRVKVKLVDAWEMTVAHHLPHNLHPQPPIIKNMINVILSYICPKGAS
uniref:Neurexophilin and PC-esterase domain family member 3 n=1 Tax=Cyprinodon variegatus TaxID=28743 RepID=A0A3Q2D490_CYPVA